MMKFKEEDEHGNCRIHFKIGTDQYSITLTAFCYIYRFPMATMEATLDFLEPLTVWINITMNEPYSTMLGCPKWETPRLDICFASLRTKPLLMSIPWYLLELGCLTPQSSIGSTTATRGQCNSIVTSFSNFHPSSLATWWIYCTWWCW